MRLWILGVVGVVFLMGCQSNSSTGAEQQSVNKVNLTKVQFSGKTMGTTYNVTYLSKSNTSYKAQMDALLVAINDEVSTYIPTATISRFNSGDTAVSLAGNTHFVANLKAAQKINEQTKGAFDPTIMPLVNYWGFGYTLKKAIENVDSVEVNRLRKLVGMEFIKYDAATKNLAKAKPGVQLDFSAIAKGYAVDEMGRLLEEKGIENYLVEIGGEARARGKNDRNEYWVIGISKPDPEARVNEFAATIALENQAIATSGNYRNNYRTDRGEYGHTINPKTGYPEKNGLLSATVFAPDCMTADALATACMEMGLPAAKIMLDSMDQISGYFIFTTPDGTLGESTSAGAPGPNL